MVRFLPVYDKTGGVEVSGMYEGIIFDVKIEGKIIVTGSITLTDELFQGMTPAQKATTLEAISKMAINVYEGKRNG